MLIVPIHIGECDLIPPPIGTVGIIRGLEDDSGDYAVLFEDYIWSHDDPYWEVMVDSLIPINLDPDAVYVATSKVGNLEVPQG
jgi:hypothetical protein